MPPLKKAARFTFPGLIPVSLCAFLSWAAPVEGAPAGAEAGRTEHVVVVIIDGLRYTEGLGDPDRTYVPEMSAIAAQGAIIEPFLNDRYTYTSRAVPAIWCGGWTGVYTFSDPSCGGAENNYTTLPTVFEYMRKGLGLPEEEVIYVLPDFGCPWRASFHADYGPDFWPLYHSEGHSDLDVWHEAQEVLTRYTPTFLLLYLSDVDHAGHSGSWSDYTEAVAVADSIVGMLWRFLESQWEYGGNTTLFVTNDHGRHTDDFSGHGCSCAGCSTIQLLAAGPEIRKGFVSTTSRTLRDITPTVGHLLGFETKFASGTVLEELFEEPVGCFVTTCFTATEAPMSSTDGRNSL